MNMELDNNIFDLSKLSKTEEVVEILKENKNIKIEKIISTGQTTDWMIQNEEEYVILLQGEAKLEFENEDSSVSEIVLKSGDTIIIEKYRKHRVSYTSENPCCIWLCLFY